MHYMYIDVNIHTQPVCPLMSTCLYTENVCMYVCIYACMHVCMYVCMYECMNVHDAIARRFLRMYVGIGLQLKQESGQAVAPHIPRHCF